MLEFQPDQARFLVKAGVGWGPEVVGVATVGSDIASSAGFALRTGKPVISNHLENEQRFRTPELLAKYGIRRAMNVILQGDGSPYGVLEVDSRSEGEFSVHDLAFLQGAANILGMAIERQRMEQSLRVAVERNQLLLKEVNHRITNSLTLVAGMLRIKAASVGEEIKSHLDEASQRINAIAQVHQRLYKTEMFERIDLGAYLKDICESFTKSLPDCEMHLEATGELEVTPDQAIPVALFVSELITNSAKHGHPNGSCTIWTKVMSSREEVKISVRDHGAGLPEDFEARAKTSLGMRLIRGFVAQLGGKFQIHRHELGVEFELVFSKQSRDTSI